MYTVQFQWILKREGERPFHFIFCPVQLTGKYDPALLGYWQGPTFICRVTGAFFISVGVVDQSVSILNASGVVGHFTLGAGGWGNMH